MNTTNAPHPPVAHDFDIVAIWHFSNGLNLPLSRAHMSQMNHSSIIRPVRGWHRILRAFECSGGIVYHPRVKYSESDIQRFIARSENWLEDL